MQFADQDHRATMLQAWATAMLHRTKDFPKRPEILWASAEHREKVQEEVDLEKTRSSMEWLLATTNADTRNANRTIMRAVEK